MHDKEEIDFEKYQNRGAYHWQSYFGSILKIDCFLRGRYEVVIHLLKKSEANKNSFILEIGCGDGALSGLIYKTFRCKLTGTEPSNLGIRFCKEMFARYNYKGTFENVGGYTFKFADNQFDFVVLADVIEHLQYPEKMLVEIKRVLKPGGRVIITTPIRTTEYPEDKMHVQEFFPNELIAVCEPTFGNPVTKIYSHPLVWYELYTFGKKINRSVIRFYCRILDKFFGTNLFFNNPVNSRWKNFKQQGLLLQKKQ